MAASERRIMPRFKLRTSMSFHRTDPLSEGEQEAKTINISTGGVYFATNTTMSVGEAIEVSLEMPTRVTGTKVSRRRFTGRVTHVEFEHMPLGHAGIGVQFFYYEAW